MDVVLYHASCADGFCAAWVFHKKYPNATYIPINYYQPVPEIVSEGGKNVYIVDFSFPREILLEIKQKSNFVKVLDHHKTAKAALEGLDFCTFDLTKSGARLAWEYLFGDEPAPILVDYVEDRDLWNWKLADSHTINAVIQSTPYKFQAFDELQNQLFQNFNLVVSNGQAILMAQDKIVASAVSRATEIVMNGHKVLCVNSTCHISEIAGELAKGRPFGVSWFEKDGERVFSLRSDEEGLDVSEIAKLYPGGGGHTHAAGFTVQVPRVTNYIG